MLKNRLFIVAWVLISLALIVYTVVVSESNRRVIGITEVEETTVSFPFPVEVSNVSVVPNQQINKDDLLLELRSEELEIEIGKLQLEIEKDRFQLQNEMELYKSKVSKLNREKRLEINKLTGELEDIQIALQNEKAISGSLNLQLADSIVNPGTIRLQNVKKELQLTDAYYNQLVNVAQLEFQTEQEKINRSIETLSQRLNFSLDKQKDLNVLALYDGYIKKVRVEKNTLMEAFTPLVTYSKLTPIYVRAYTDEQTRLTVSLGSTVTVSSASRKWINTEGVIIAESKRVTELPERLKLQPFSQEWGQEFLVKLPADNSFLIGEKVLIK